MNDKENREINIDQLFLNRNTRKKYQVNGIKWRRNQFQYRLQREHICDEIEKKEALKWRINNKEYQTFNNSLK